MATNELEERLRGWADASEVAWGTSTLDGDLREAADALAAARTGNEKLRGLLELAFEHVPDDCPHYADIDEALGERS